MPGLSATPWTTIPGVAPGEDPVREVAGPLARPAAEQDEVGGRERPVEHGVERGLVVADDPQRDRLAPELADGVGQEGRVGVVDRRRPERRRPAR